MWSDYSIITYLVHTAITVPPRSDSRSDPWVIVSSNDSGITMLPRGYRVPLLWLMKVQWESLKILLTAARPLWDTIKWDILHIARLITQFLAKARNEVRMKRQWRDPMFDRTLTRFFNGWMGCSEVFIWDFYQEFKDEEYKDDMLARRWTQKVLKGIQGFVITQQELVNGITAQQFMAGLNVDRHRETFEWIAEAEVELPPTDPQPSIQSPKRKDDEEAPTMNSRGSSPLTSDMGSDIEMIPESLNRKTPTPVPTPSSSMQRPSIPLAIQTGPELQRKKSHKAKPRPKTDRPEKTSRPIRTRIRSGSVSGMMSPATSKIAHLSRSDLSVPGSSASSPSNRTPSGFDFTAPVESRSRKRKIESVYSISPSPLTSDAEDDSSGKGSAREPKSLTSRPVPRPVQNATPDGRAFSTNSWIVIPRLSNPELYSRPVVEAYPSPTTPRKPSASETSSPRRAKSPIVPLHHYKLYAISSSPSTNPFDPQNPATSIPPFSFWRHPDELEYIGPNHPAAAQWTDFAIVAYMVDNAFTIPSRNADNKQTLVEVKVSNRDGTVTSTTLPRGYGIPLLWLGKVQWDCLKLLLTSGKEYWSNLRFDILHIARLSVEFLAMARKEVKMKRQYRNVMFDRALSRFFNGWMGSRDEIVWDFYREFQDEEYKNDILRRRWLPKAVKGIQSFAVSEYELNEGITAEQFMRGLNLDREKGTFEWIDLDEAAPAPVATVPAIEAPPVPVIEAPPHAPVEPSPLRVELAHPRALPPLSLSQVIGVHSASPSPLTPVFGLDHLMDVDPPAQRIAAAPSVVPDSDQRPEQAPQSAIVVDEVATVPAIEAPSSNSMGVMRSSGSRSGSSQRPRPYPTPAVSAQMRNGLFMSTPPQSVNDRNMHAIIPWLDQVFQDKKGSYIRFLACRDASAQQLLDLLQDLLDYDSNLATINKRRLIKALIRLSGDSGLHPRCYTLTGLELGEHLAGGSFSDVYQGSLSGQHVGIKMMRVFGKRNIDQVLKEFGREALIWRQLSHPNLLPFFGLYQLQNRLCLVSPWMENGNLQAFLRESQDSYSADRLISWILDVALGLRYLHNEHVVHGDLKAENIFVTPSLRACIADFGLSSIITTMSSLQFMSSSHAQGGTTRYQAPELLRGGQNGLHSDMYAFACVAYQLVAGKHPFWELRYDSAVIKAVVDGLRPSQPTSCSGTPLLDGLWILLQNCWEDLPEKRPTAVQTVDRLTGPVIQAKTVQSSADWDETFTSRFRRSFLRQPTLLSVSELEQIIFG
ncbi:hypothetical protein B0H13DRAFT_2663935 [Mycena leptocephala]|nr:hypothetical protein B0H13DRAFT_2663935 [Mycena leptocephala]